MPGQVVAYSWSQKSLEVEMTFLSVHGALGICMLIAVFVVVQIIVLLLLGQDPHRTTLFYWMGSMFLTLVAIAVFLGVADFMLTGVKEAYAALMKR